MELLHFNKKLQMETCCIRCLSVRSCGTQIQVFSCTKTFVNDIKLFYDQHPVLQQCRSNSTFSKMELIFLWQGESGISRFETLESHLCYSYWHRIRSVSRTNFICGVYLLGNLFFQFIAFTFNGIKTSQLHSVQLKRFDY